MACKTLLVLPPEIRTMIWNHLISETTLCVPRDCMTNGLKLLYVSRRIRAEVIPMILHRITFDVDSHRAPVPLWVNSAEHLVIQPSQSTLSSLSSAPLAFPRLKSATLVWPKPTQSIHLTLAALLGDAKGEARRYGISALFRVRFLHDRLFRERSGAFEQAARVRNKCAPKNVPKIEARIKIMLALNATMTVDMLQEGLRGVLVVDGCEAEVVETIKPLQLWRHHVTQPSNLRAMGYTHEMLRLFDVLCAAEVKTGSEFRSHLRYAIQHNLLG